MSSRGGCCGGGCDEAARSQIGSNVGCWFFETTTPSKQIYLLPEEYKRAAVHRIAEERELASSVQLKHLQAEIKRLQGVIVFKDQTLLYVGGYFEDVLANNNPQSVGRIRRLISQLKGAAQRCRGGLPE